MATYLIVLVFRWLLTALPLLALIVLPFCGMTAVQDMPCGIHFSDGIMMDGEEKKDYYTDYFHRYNAECGLFFMEWEGGRCTIVRAHDVQFSLSYRECTEDYYGVVHPGENDHIDVKFVLGGIPGLREMEFETVNDVQQPIFPEKYDFEFGGRHYELYAEGDYTGDEYDQAEDVRIYLRDSDGDTTQELVYFSKLEHTAPSVIFIGDLDGDGLPDLILSQGYNYEYVVWALYLSSMAEGEELVRRAASHSYWADC